MQYLITLLALASFSIAAPSTHYKGSIGNFGSTDHSVTPAMCTDSTYPAGPFGSPQGSGFCSTPEADFNCCYKFSDYPGLEQLNHNLTFIFMPNNFKCELYTDYKCKGKFALVVSGENDLSNPELGDTAFNDKTNSFKCYSS